jgi:hypothetical protein
MNWPYTHFSKEEMSCPCGCGGLPGVRLMEILEGLRVLTKIVMPVTSGFRCAAYDAQIGGKGEHALGFAADVSVRGEDARTLIKAALCVFDVPRIGVQQPTGEPQGEHFVHFGVATIEEGYPRAVWSYSK